jgi:preprotein translocase subunit SecF
MSEDKKNKQMVRIMSVLLIIMSLIIFLQWRCNRQCKSKPESVVPVLVTNPPTNSALQKKLVDVSGVATNGLIEFRGDQTKLIFPRSDK